MPLVVIGFVPLTVRPVVPPDNPTLVTVPVNWSFEVIVKLGYVPVTTVVPAPVSETTWSGSVLVIVIEPDALEMLIAVPAVNVESV